MRTSHTHAPTPDQTARLIADHDHDHDHERQLTHEPSHEQAHQHGPPGQPGYPHTHAQEAIHRVHTSPVVMDIGNGTGSLVIYTPPEWAGLEIEISPADDDTRRVHTDVAERRMGQRSIFAAVYLPMLAGVYTIWAPTPHGATTVTVAADAITELDWR